MTIIDRLIEDACRKTVECHLSEAFGRRVTLTKQEFTEYCDAAAESDNQAELESAISLVEANGYRVVKG